MKHKLDSDAFVKELIKVFPNLADEILDEDNLGLISLQISWLTRYTQQAINKGDIDITKKSLLFINDFYDGVSDEVLNSIDLSYLNKLEFNNNDSIEHIIPIKLKKIIDSIVEAHKTPMDERVSKYLASIQHKK